MAGDGQVVALVVVLVHVADLELGLDDGGLRAMGESLSSGLVSWLRLYQVEKSEPGPLPLYPSKSLTMR